MERRTKITATLGPATDSREQLAQLLRAGTNVVRINFSHGHAEEHRDRVQLVRAVSAELGLSIAIVGDLQGPKVRIGAFADGAVNLVEGQSFVLDIDMDPAAGDEHAVALGYPALIDDVAPGDVLLLNDGAIGMKVTAVAARHIDCQVLNSGQLASRKGLNLRGGGLSADGLTAQDYTNIQLAAELELDFLAVSFVRSAKDLEQARQALRKAGGNGRIVAKIERAEALAALDPIISASDAVMVARGDLAVEIGDPELPAVQKRIISRAREMNRLVITATQMMESMIEHPTPTRAEVLDVANAVLDGTDSVMLSAETAIGTYAAEAVAAMSRICVGAERGDIKSRRSRELESHFLESDEAVAMATAYTARNMRADAIIALTDSGTTAMLMSRQEVGIPIYAVTRTAATCRYLALCRGVQPVWHELKNMDGLAPVHEAIECLRARAAVAEGNRVLITKGDREGPGGTNTMKIITVGGRVRFVQHAG